MGEIQDRSLEHRGPSDGMIIHTRIRVLAAIKAHQAGEMPPGASNPECHHNARGGDFVASASLDWREAYARQLTDARNPAGVQRVFSGIRAPRDVASERGL